jgi:RHS repeat-associated protein
VQTPLNYTGQRLDGTGLLYYHARYYDPILARFISADSVAPGAGALTLAPHDATAQAAWAAGGGGPANPQQLNRYSYVTNNPVNKTDPTGHWLESAIDIASIAYDVYDISQNGLTVTSGLALAADIASLALPVVAGGGAAVRAIAHADDVVDAVAHADDVVDAVQAADRAGEVAQSARRAPDFVVTPDGVAVPVSQARMQDGFNRAGFPNRPSTETAEQGAIYTVPTQRGPIDVRAMEGSTHHPRRAVFNTPGTHSPRTPSGSTPRGTRAEQRAASHLEQEP